VDAAGAVAGSPGAVSAGRGAGGVAVTSELAFQLEVRCSRVCGKGLMACRPWCGRVKGKANVGTASFCDAG
jgi:hypothetical protein